MEHSGALIQRGLDVLHRLPLYSILTEIRLGYQAMTLMLTVTE